MKKFLRFNFQLVLLIAAGLFFQNSWGQVSISAHNTNVTTALSGWNGTLPSGYAMSGGGSYIGTSATTTGGVYAIPNAGFGYQASGGVSTVELTGTYRNNTGSPITSLQISYKAFLIINRDSRKPNWTVTSSLGSVSALNWTFNASNTVNVPANKTVTLSNLNIANNATFTISFASDRGTGSSSSPLIGMKDVVVKSIQEETTVVINTNPTSLAFEDTEVGSFSESKTVAVTGTGLTAPINITTFPTFQVSLDDIDWDTAATLPSTGGTVYVRFSPPSTGGLSTGLALASTGATTKYVSLTGTGIPAVTRTISTNTATFGPFCNSEANTFNVSFTKVGTYTAPNFSVQLSDAEGNFPSTATNIIGTGATSPISATIPANTGEGNYKVRVINENPLTLSNDNGSDIVISVPSVGGTVSGGGTFCAGSNSGTLTLTGYVGTITKWQASTTEDFSSNVVDIPVTLPTLEFSDVPQTAYVRAVIANGACDAVNSDVVTITINPVVTPDFAQIPAFCAGSAAPVLALVSPNGITGTWSPATISNTENGTYVFTPDANQCASEQTLTVTVNEVTAPDFAQIPAFCAGSAAPELALVSPNGITGTWSPATISNTENGTYVFTPDANQCASEQTLNVTVNEVTAPDFAQIPAFCAGSTAPVLALVSPNGITGTWSPATISNTENGTYVFTPDANQCASEQTLNVTVNETLPPTGDSTQDFTSGDTLEDFIVVGQDIKWYDALTGSNELQDSELIVSGTTYYVSQTLNGCESTRLPITAGEDLSTDSFDMSQLKYYPNPTNNILNLEYTQTISSVTVYNLVGQQVLLANPNTNSVKMDLSNLNSGTYFVNIHSDNTSKTIKVIKK